MNPCACGYFGDSSGRCRYTPAQVDSYRARISGPLLDRIDLFVEVPRLPLADVAAGDTAPGLTTAAAARMVAQARQRQLARRGCLNRELPQAQLQASATLQPEASRLLQQVFEKLGLSARSYQRVLRVR